MKRRQKCAELRTRELHVRRSERCGSAEDEIVAREHDAAGNEATAGWSELHSTKGGLAVVAEEASRVARSFDRSQFDTHRSILCSVNL